MHAGLGAGAYARRMSGVGEQSDKAEVLIERYELITEIDVTRRNVEQTLRLLKQIKALPDKVAELRQVLLEDDTRLDWVHMQLRRLERSRSSMPEHPVLNEHFREVDELREEVLNRIRSIIRDALKYGQEAPAMLVSAVRIVEREEKSLRRHRLADEREARIVGGAVSPSGSRGSGAGGRLCFGEAGLLCGPYGQMMEEALASSVENRFMAVLGLAVDDPEVGIIDLFEMAGFVLDDLSDILDAVVACFPPKYDIFRFIGQEYHTRLYEYLQRKIGSMRLAPLEILSLRAYAQQHEDDVSGRTGLAGLKPPLVESFEPLMGTFRQQVQDMCAEWVRGIVASTTEPHDVYYNHEGLRCTDAPIALFRMVNEWVEPTADSSRGQLLFDVATLCCNALRAYQDGVSRKLTELQREAERSGQIPMGLPGSYDFELSQQRSPRVAERPKGRWARFFGGSGASASQVVDEEAEAEAAAQLLEQTAAVIGYILEQVNNSAMCCFDHIASFRETVLDLLEPEFASQEDMFDEAEDAFSAGAQLGLRVLACMMATEFRPMFDLLFSKAASDPFDAAMSEVIGQLEYYYAPAGPQGFGLGEQVHPDFFDRLVVYNAESIAKMYVVRLMTCKEPWSLDNALKLREDLEAFEGFLKDVAPSAEKKIDTAISCFKVVVDFIAGGRNVALWVDTLVRAHPDMDAKQLEHLVNIRSRDDPKDKPRELEECMTYYKSASFSKGAAAEPGIFTEIRALALK